MSDAVVQISRFDRAIRRISSVWRDMGSGVADTDQGIAAQMHACLAARGGEISARNRAAKLAETYLTLPDAERRAFLLDLASFDSDPAAIDAAHAALHDASAPQDQSMAMAALRRALEPPRVRLLTQFTTIPGGMKFLVDLRATLITLMGHDKRLMALESDLLHLLASWFDVGFLELVRIDWNSPAVLLERLVGYEAVHQIRSWTDLKNRLDSDRRCYALFHHRMPNEPLIFVEVALVRGLSDSVQRLLDLKAPLLDPGEADTAIFYSISNCQKGLAGISFGNFLIKRVVDVLGRDFRTLKQFATLSPIPGFRKWLDPKLADDSPALLSDEESAALRGVMNVTFGHEALSGPQALAALLARPRWQRDPALTKVAEPVLTRLAAHYLLIEKRGRRALDSVAHFHLSNGARVERVMMGADVSAKGLRESASLMVNYLYDPAKIEAYHEDYAGEGKCQASTAVRKLAKGWG